MRRVIAGAAALLFAGAAFAQSAATVDDLPPTGGAAAAPAPAPAPPPTTAAAPTPVEPAPESAAPPPSAAQPADAEPARPAAPRTGRRVAAFWIVVP